jgi:hypothetical protein
MPTVKLHYGQSQVLKASQRIVMAVAGVGGGKSWCAPVWMAKEILAHPGNIFTICAPTYTILDRSTMQAYRDQWTGTDFDGNWVDKKEWRFKNKKLGKLYTISMDDYLSVQGFHPMAVHCDESGQYSEPAWRAIYNRCSKNYSRILLTSTPYNSQGWFAEMYDKAKRDPNNYSITTWPSWWNPTFNVKSYIEAKKLYPSNYFHMYYDGQLGVVEDAQYPDFTADNIRDTRYDPNLPIIVGSDFNKRNMSWTLSKEINNEIHVFDEIRILVDATATKALDVLYHRYRTHTKGFYFYGDATAQSNTRDRNASESDYITIKSDPRFVQLGRTVYYPPKQPHIKDRVMAVNAYVCVGKNRRLFVDPSCKFLIEDFRMSKWNKDGKTDKLFHDPHSSEALGYYIAYAHPLKVPYSTNFIGLGIANYATR